MKQNNLAVLIGVIVISVVISLFVSKLVFSSTKHLEQVAVVDKIDSEFPVEQVTGPGNVTVEAVAKPGYELKGKTSWTFSFTYETSGLKNLPQDVAGSVPAGDQSVSDESSSSNNQLQTVTATPPSFYDLSGTINDTYVIPVTAGVNYEVNGIVTAAGAYTGPDKQFNSKAFNPAQIVNIGQPNNHPFASKNDQQP